MNFSIRVLEFYKSLPSELNLPGGVSLIQPFSKEKIWPQLHEFYNKYYNDSNSRNIILGINPGRFGAGITGIPFTDAYHLEKLCGIQNDLEKRKELSSVFIYDLVMRMGGPQKFYSNFYLSSVCPLGFIKENKNYNYYDSKKLLGLLKKFIVDSISRQLDFPCNRKRAFSLGKTKNYDILTELNKEYKWFDEIVSLPHPRWVIQYQRKNYEFHLESISSQLKSIID